MIPICSALRNRAEHFNFPAGGRKRPGDGRKGRNEWKRDRVAGKCARTGIVRRGADRRRMDRCCHDSPLGQGRVDISFPSCVRVCIYVCVCVRVRVWFLIPKNLMYSHRQVRTTSRSECNPVYNFAAHVRTAKSICRK